MQSYRLREGIDFDGSLKLRYFSQIVTEAVLKIICPSNG